MRSSLLAQWIVFALHAKPSDGTMMPTGRVLYL
jgi:hypothetical protein